MDQEFENQQDDLSFAEIESFAQSTQEEIQEVIPEEKKKVPSKWVRELLEWCETLVVAVVAVILLFTFGFRTSQVYGSSMVPTLNEGDVVLISRLVPEYSYGDVVVLTKPNDYSDSLIKRIVATEGQTVDIDFQQGIVYVDGVALEEDYINEPTHDQYDVEFPVTVPEGCIFVMGDNRNASADSRTVSIGMVDTRYVLGKAFVIVFPIEDMGGL